MANKRRTEFRASTVLVRLGNRWVRAAFIEMTERGNLHWESEGFLGYASKGYWMWDR